MIDAPFTARTSRGLVNGRVSQYGWHTTDSRSDDILEAGGPSTREHVARCARNAYRNALTELDAACDYLTGHGMVDQQELAEMSAEEIRSAVHHDYPGGWEQFVTDTHEQINQQRIEERAA